MRKGNLKDLSEQNEKDIVFVINWVNLISGIKQLYIKCPGCF